MKNRTFVVPSPNDGTVAGLGAALEVLRAVDDQMTLGIAISFLTVAMFEGRSLREYSEMLNLAQSTMSRHLLDLGLMYRDRSPGLGLINQEQDKDDMRKNVYCLSPKGKALIEEVGQKLGGRLRRFHPENIEGYSEADLVELNAAWKRLVEGLLSASDQGKLDWIISELGDIRLDSIPGDYAARLISKLQIPGYKEDDKSRQERIAEELRFKFDQGLRGRALVRETFLHLWLYGVDGNWDDCQ